jgi:hypothetical protein
MRSSHLAESAQLFADFRLTNDVIPVIDVAAMIANVLHPPIEGEGRRKRAQRLQVKQTWEGKIEAAIANELPVLNAVTLERINPATSSWLGSACVTREALVSWLRLHHAEAVANRLMASIDDSDSSWGVSQNQRSNKLATTAPAPGVSTSKVSQDQRKSGETQPGSPKRTRARRITLAARQEQAILTAILCLEFKAKAFPTTSGVAGAKSKVRAHVEKAHRNLFPSPKSRVFGKAWQRLRHRREIIDANDGLRS